jgi:chaperonin cofactor prefoldin
MGIAFVIVGGVVVTTLIASVFDFLGKKKRKVDTRVESTISQLEERLSVLEAKTAEKDERISQLESEVSFVNKLIEGKTR